MTAATTTTAAPLISDLLESLPPLTGSASWAIINSDRAELRTAYGRRVTLRRGTEDDAGDWAAHVHGELDQGFEDHAIDDVTDLADLLGLEWAIKVEGCAEPAEIGDWIEIKGDDPHEYDRGEVIGIRGDRVQIAWRGGASAEWHRPRELGPVHLYSGKPAEWAREWPQFDEDGNEV